MARRREDSLDRLFEWLRSAPIWVGPVAAVIVWVVLGFVVPIAANSAPSGGAEIVHAQTAAQKLANALAEFAPIAGILVLLVWLVSLAARWKAAARLSSQTGIDSIRRLGWGDFEKLLAQYYRSLGYQVEHAGRAGADGGVDLRLRRDGMTTLVQCKHWRAWKVGEPIVRELLGSIHKEKAAKGILVTSGSFTADAVAFCADQPITLVSGTQLEQLIGQAQSRAKIPEDGTGAQQPSSPPSCPLCQSPMVLRNARRGPRMGTAFWGCMRYPQCRGTRDRTA